MELQLGLALSLPVHHNLPVRGFDMSSNRVVGEKNEMVMGLDIWSYGCCSLERKKKIKMSSFDMTFEKNESDDESKTLPLFLWSGQPNDEDDDGKRQKKRNSCSLIAMNEEEGNQIVGWPPIKSWRKKMFFHDHDHQQYDHRERHDLQNHHQVLANENDGSENSMYIKVKMEGVGIMRKVDIKLHHSYQTLTDALITMFAKYKECNDEDTADFTLTYQDKEGEWLLAGDVPWQRFVESVQRLEIVRNGG